MLFFYQPALAESPYLEDEEYQHCVKVLRKKVGDTIGLLDGKGKKTVGIISEITPKRCLIRVTEETTLPPKPFHNHIAIAPAKNPDRNEWFVEKACELGVDEISLIKTHHSERTKLRTDRLEKKAISALKQSKNGWLTRINPVVELSEFLAEVSADQRFIAVVENNLPYFSSQIRDGKSSVCLIGPEGDFSTEEVKQALKHGFQKISLGKSVLRTETAGLMASHFINMANEF